VSPPGCEGFKLVLEIFQDRALWELLVMKSKIFAVCVLSAALAVAMGQAAVADVVMNGGFEAPVLGTEMFYETAPMGVTNLLPTVPGWEFSASPIGGSSEAGMLSASGIGPWQAQAFGSQCAAFHGDGNTVYATITQTLAGVTEGPATFSFYAQGLQSKPLNVTVDGTALTFGGTAMVTPGSAMTKYTSDSITLAAGAHALQFQAYGWTYLDNVSTTAVPEPASITLLTAGLVGLLAYAWRKRK
jgi:hypothetical protein